MDRRAFLGSLGGAVLAAPLVAEAQRGRKVLRIGYLSPAGATALESGWLLEFRTALSKRGYSEGTGFALEQRYANDRLERLPALATELVNLGVDLFLTLATPATLAAKAATGTIPVVMIAVGDPLGVGIVKSLNRPDSNITGLALNNVDTAGKRLDFLKQAVPGLSRVAVLANPQNQAFTALHIAETQKVADRIGIALERLELAGPERLAETFTVMAKQRVSGVIVLPDPTFSSHRERIAQLALQHRLPSVAPESQFVGAGCLLAYGPDVAEIYRQAARFVDKILKGTRPGDLPVEQPTTFELGINLRTAKTLGLTIPPSLLVRADQVIE
jgi:putative ABC transport system substrate-binding protein